MFGRINRLKSLSTIAYRFPMKYATPGLALSIDTSTWCSFYLPFHNVNLFLNLDFLGHSNIHTVCAFNLKQLFSCPCKMNKRSTNLPVFHKAQFYLITWKAQMSFIESMDSDWCAALDWQLKKIFKIFCLGLHFELRLSYFLVVNVY